MYFLLGAIVCAVVLPDISCGFLWWYMHLIKSKLYQPPTPPNSTRKYPNFTNKQFIILRSKKRSRNIQQPTNNPNYSQITRTITYLKVDKKCSYLLRYFTIISLRPTSIIGWHICIFYIFFMNKLVWVDLFRYCGISYLGYLSWGGPMLVLLFCGADFHKIQLLKSVFK